eukprot:232388-Pyramimonas_sp.AAC.1
MDDEGQCKFHRRCRSKPSLQVQFSWAPASVSSFGGRCCVRRQPPEYFQPCQSTIPGVSCHSATRGTSTSQVNVTVAPWRSETVPKHHLGDAVDTNPWSC